MTRPAQESPWQTLFRLAAKQEGLFSARQAVEIGCSQQLVGKYLSAGRVERVRRGVYRIADFPAGDHEDLMAVWLWSKNEGVLSHETALFLHNLSDALPIRAHVTLPAAWKTRVLLIPQDVAAYYADVAPDHRGWVGPLPVTSVRRTISDCVYSQVSPELVAQASSQAAERGLITPAEVLSAPGIELARLRSN